MMLERRMNCERFRVLGCFDAEGEKAARNRQKCEIRGMKLEGGLGSEDPYDITR